MSLKESRVLWLACVRLRGRQDSGLRDPGCLYRAMFTCTTRSAQSWHLLIFFLLFKNSLSGRNISAPACCVHMLQRLRMLSARPSLGTSSCCSIIVWSCCAMPLSTVCFSVGSTFLSASSIWAAIVAKALVSTLPSGTEPPAC